MCTLDGNCLLVCFFFLLCCLQIRLRITYYLLFLRKEANKNARIHATKSIKRIQFRRAFTIEAVVISEVFTFGVISQWAENSCGEPCVERRYVVLMLIPTVFSSSTPLLLCGMAWRGVRVCARALVLCWTYTYWIWWCFECPSRKQCAVCNEMTMQLVINYKMCVPFWRVISVCRQIYFVYSNAMCVSVCCVERLVLFPKAIDQSWLVQMAIWGIVIAVLEIANAIETLEILFAHFIFFLSFDPIYFCSPARRRKKIDEHAFFFILSRLEEWRFVWTERKDLTNWSSSLATNRQK